MCRDTPHEAWAILWKTEPRTIMPRIVKSRNLCAPYKSLRSKDVMKRAWRARNGGRAGATTRRDLGVHDSRTDAVRCESRIASRSGMVNPATSAILKRAILRPVPEQPTSAPSDAILIRRIARCLGVAHSGAARALRPRNDLLGVPGTVLARDRPRGV